MTVWLYTHINTNILCTLIHQVEYTRVILGNFTAAIKQQGFRVVANV